MYSGANSSRPIVGRRKIGERMADELGCDAALAVELLFEGEDNQHLADVLANALDAPLLPSPQLRADVVNDGYVQLMEFASKAQVEVWEVDENSGIGTAAPWRR